MQFTYTQTCCRTQTNQPAHTRTCTYTYKHVHIYTIYTYVCRFHTKRHAATHTSPPNTRANRLLNSTHMCPCACSTHANSMLHAHYSTPKQHIAY